MTAHSAGGPALRLMLLRPGAGHNILRRHQVMVPGPCQIYALRFRFVPGIAVIIYVAAASAQAPFTSDRAIDSILQRAIATHRTAGIVVGLIEADGSQRIFARGSAGPGQPALDRHSVFEIGSITKV